MIIKIAITDDHEMVLQGVTTMMENTSEVCFVGSYRTAEETLGNIGKDMPDVLLLDLNLPDQNGIDLAKILLKKYSDLKIIALTNFESISLVKRSLKVGFHGYLLKNTDKMELMKALKTVLSGEVFITNDIHKRLLSQTNEKLNDNGLNPNLTRREYDVLKAIYEELTTQQISEKLFISPKTVETHRMNLMSKLGAKNSVGIIKIALEKQLL